MQTRFRKLFLLLPLLLASCIAVKDFGNQWNAGTLDPALEGRWITTDRSATRMVFAAEGNEYIMTYISSQGETEPQLARTLKLGESTFLMLKKKESDAGGTMIAYAISGNQMAFFMPHRERRAELEQQYPNHPFIISRSGITIPLLDEQSIDMLKILASDPKWWQEMKRYNRD